MKRNGQCQGSARRAVRPFFATVRLCARQTLDGNLLGIYGEYAVRFVQFALLTMIWRALAAQGADLGGMTLRALLTYTLMASVWRQQLNILTPATSALWEGSIIGRFTRPVSILTSLAAETVGRWWVPVFVLYSLPLLLLSPLLGISCLPAGGLCGALISTPNEQPRSAVSSDTAGVGNTPAAHTSAPPAAMPAASAPSIAGPDERVSRATNALPPTTAASALPAR